jgi:hypothetical protein
MFQPLLGLKKLKLNLENRYNYMAKIQNSLILVFSCIPICLLSRPNSNTHSQTNRKLSAYVVHRISKGEANAYADGDNRRNYSAAVFPREPKATLK